jgi:hypothetical protein
MNGCFEIELAMLATCLKTWPCNHWRAKGTAIGFHTVRILPLVRHVHRQDKGRRQVRHVLGLCPFQLSDNARRSVHF